MDKVALIWIRLLLRRQVLELLEKITGGKGEMKDLDKLEETAKFIQSRSLCGLGKSAPLPVISTLKRFRDEYATPHTTFK